MPSRGRLFVSKTEIALEMQVTSQITTRTATRLSPQASMGSSGTSAGRSLEHPRTRLRNARNQTRDADRQRRARDVDVASVDREHLADAGARAEHDLDDGAGLPIGSRTRDLVDAGLLAGDHGADFVHLETGQGVGHPCLAVDAGDMMHRVGGTLCRTASSSAAAARRAAVWRGCTKSSPAL